VCSLLDAGHPGNRLELSSAHNGSWCLDLELGRRKMKLSLSALAAKGLGLCVLIKGPGRGSFLKCKVNNKPPGTARFRPMCSKASQQLDWVIRILINRLTACDCCWPGVMGGQVDRRRPYLNSRQACRTGGRPSR
jgi:hypothetical protein